MGTRICIPNNNMPGVRCGARLRQRMEVHLGFASSVVGQQAAPLPSPPLWRTTPAAVEESCSAARRRPQTPGCNGGPPSRRSPDAAAGLPSSSSVSAYSQVSHVSGSKGFGLRSLPVVSSPSHYSSADAAAAGFLGWGCPRGHRFTSSGLGCASRVAFSPRVVPELPETAKSWLESQRLCPGCGIEMQEEDAKAPGFFQRPVAAEKRGSQELDEEDASAEDGELLNIVDGSEQEGTRKPKEVLEWVDISSAPEIDVEGDVSEWGEDKRRGRRGGRRKREKSGQGVAESAGEMPVVVCARCHALRNYGKVKDESVENLLPDFDFERVVGSKLRKSIGRRAVVLMVIDSVDFDGSFPRMAATLLADAERELGNSWQEGKAANVPRLLVVLNKADLLPGQLSPVRLEQWARRRSRAGGVTQISGVHIVSAFRGWGVDKLSKQVIEMAGPRGDVWVIGAQNVGKSSLINALGKHAVETAAKRADGTAVKKNALLTEAAIPGTTVGVLKLEGILPGKARLLDTPGLLHPHQITTRLTREEQKMVQIRKVLKPRTFRVKVGHAISVGGLMRLKVSTAPGESIYATIWASPYIPCHMGKGETAEELFHKHIGEKLQPPLSKERVDELGRWVARTVEVSGTRWDKSSVDIAVAGVGWIALALSGSARLEVWTYEGVAVTVRDAMVLDLAPVMERPGFTAPVKTSGKGKN